MKINVGDWVCFRSSGKLVYAKVEYVIKAKTPVRDLEVVTTEGSLYPEDVIELRPVAAGVKQNEPRCL